MQNTSLTFEVDLSFIYTACTAHPSSAPQAWGKFHFCRNLSDMRRHPSGIVGQVMTSSKYSSTMAWHGLSVIGDTPHILHCGITASRCKMPQSQCKLQSRPQGFPVSSMLSGDVGTNPVQQHCLDRSCAS